MVTPPYVHQDPRYQLLGTYAKASYRPISEEIDKIRDSGDLSRARRFLDKAKIEHPSRPDLWQKHEELLQEAHGRVLRRKLSDINRNIADQSKNQAARVRYVQLEAVTIGWSPRTVEKVSECIIAYVAYRVDPSQPPITTPVPPEDGSFRIGENWHNEGKLFYDKLDEIRKLWRTTRLTPIPKPNDIRRTSYVEQPDDFDKNGFKDWLMQEWSIKLVTPTPAQQAEIQKLGGKNMPHRLVKRPPPSAAKSRSASRKGSSASFGSTTSVGTHECRASSHSSRRTSSSRSSIVASGSPSETHNQEKARARRAS